jgi:hypothetical protein
MPKDYSLEELRSMAAKQSGGSAPKSQDKSNPIIDTGKKAAGALFDLGSKAVGGLADQYEQKGRGPLRLALDALLPGVGAGEQKDGKGGLRFPSGQEILKSRGLSEGPAKYGGQAIDFLADPAVLGSAAMKTVGALGRAAAPLVGDGIAGGVSRAASAPNKFAVDLVTSARDKMGSAVGGTLGAGVDAALGSPGTGTVIGGAVGSVTNKALKNVLKGAPSSAANAVNNAPSSILDALAAYNSLKFSGKKKK